MRRPQEEFASDPAAAARWTLNLAEQANNEHVLEEMCGMRPPSRKSVMGAKVYTQKLVPSLIHFSMTTLIHDKLKNNSIQPES